MEIIKIAVLILIVITTINTIPTFNKEISVLISIAGCIVILLYITKEVIPAIEYIKNIAETIAFSDMDIILKAVGVGFITQFVSDMALDCGNKALANQMIFAGRITILLLAMPVFLQIFEIIQQLIGR